MATPTSTPPPGPDLGAVTGDPGLHNADLAPLPVGKRRWGAFEIVNVWSNDVQSLFGYTLAASLFLTSGLNGWWVFTAIVLAGAIVMVLVNLTGRPSVRYGIPYAVMARAAMGVQGAKFPALVRAVVAIFYYGVQTYFAATAVSLFLGAVLGVQGGPTFLGMSGADWVSYVLVAVFQVALFIRGIDGITRFLNWAGPGVYLVMIALMIFIWVRAGGGLLAELGSIFEGTGAYDNGAVLAFVGVVGTMLAYFAAVVINYGDFSRFVRTDRQMRLGNLIGLPVGLAFFSFLALVITAGASVLYGESLTTAEEIANPTAIVAEADTVLLTAVAALTFFVATVGINLVANFIPPAYDLANLAPQRISARTGGMITAAVAFVIGALWVSVISQIGITGFVDTLGAVLAPLYGILVADYYLVRRQHLEIADLFSASPDGLYYYQGGWNRRALIAFAVGAVFSVASVWVPSLAALSGFAWVLGASIGALAYVTMMRGHLRTARGTE